MLVTSSIGMMLFGYQLTSINCTFEALWQYNKWDYDISFMGSALTKKEKYQTII